MFHTFSNALSWKCSSTGSQTCLQPYSKPACYPLHHGDLPVIIQAMYQFILYLSKVDRETDKIMCIDINEDTFIFFIPQLMYWYISRSTIPICYWGLSFFFKRLQCLRFEVNKKKCKYLKNLKTDATKKHFKTAMTHGLKILAFSLHMQIM